jgi:hypothetical protein
MQLLPDRFAMRRTNKRSEHLDSQELIGCNSIGVNKIRIQVGGRLKKHRRLRVVGPLFAFRAPHQASPTGPTGHGRGGYRVGRHLNSRSHGAQHRAIRFFRALFVATGSSSVVK